MTSERPPTARDPSPVNVQNVDPIPVEVMQDEPLRVRTEQDKVAATRVSTSDKALAEAKVQADVVRADAAIDASVLTTHGQRRINLIWERTQAFIAIEVVTVTLLVVLAVVLGPLVTADTTDGARNAAIAGMVLLSNLTGIVIGTYFQRTNHQKIGGVQTGDAGR